jgi:ribosomal protein S18 acetylase RimI-like enzyme
MNLYREAAETDLPSICILGEGVNALHHEWSPALFAPPGDPARHLAWWQQSIGAAMATTFVAETAGEVIGFVNVTIINETVTLMQPVRFARIGTVGVAPAHRGKGIGHALMICAERWAITRGAVDLRLTVATQNAGALRLYEELGFELRSHSFGKLLARSAP